MQINVQCMEGEAGGPPDGPFSAPFVVESDWPLKTREPKLPVQQWLSGKCTALMTSEGHDGTMLFELAQIDALTRTAERLAAERGGEWVISHIAQKSTFVDSMPMRNGGSFPGQRDLMLLLMQRV